MGTCLLIIERTPDPWPLPQSSVSNDNRKNGKQSTIRTSRQFLPSFSLVLKSFVYSAVRFWCEELCSFKKNINSSLYCYEVKIFTLSWTQRFLIFFYCRNQINDLGSCFKFQVVWRVLISSNLTWPLFCFETISKAGLSFVLLVAFGLFFLIPVLPNAFVSLIDPYNERVFCLVSALLAPLDVAAFIAARGLKGVEYCPSAAHCCLALTNQFRSPRLTPLFRPEQPQQEQQLSLAFYFVIKNFYNLRLLSILTAFYGWMCRCGWGSWFSLVVPPSVAIYV